MIILLAAGIFLLGFKFKTDTLELCLTNAGYQHDETTK